MADDQTPKKTSDVARRIWLAGIGAYGKAFDVGRAQLEKLSDASGGLFDQLAEKGEKLETAAKIKGAQLAGKASNLSEDLHVDERINAMRERLSGAVPSLGGGGSDARMDAVEAKLASIEEKLDALLKAQASPKRAATKKAPAKKTAAKKTAPAKTTTSKK